jgi:hypothetical protein
MELAKTYPDMDQPAAPLGVLLDSNLERDWRTLEPMPQFTSLLVDAPYITPDIDRWIAAYAPILRFLFPRLSSLRESRRFDTQEEFRAKLSAELGNIRWMDWLDDPSWS